nr:hypothetical protein [Tanacetum cinerariifolium]
MLKIKERWTPLPIYTCPQVVHHVPNLPGLTLNYITLDKDSEYDADSSENEEVNDYADVMIDEENEIHEADVEVHLFGLRESDYQFTNVGVSSEVPDNVFMKKDAFEMDIDVFDTDSGGEGDCPSGRIHAINKLKKAFM